MARANAMKDLNFFDKGLPACENQAVGLHTLVFDLAVLLLDSCPITMGFDGLRLQEFNKLSSSHITEADCQDDMRAHIPGMFGNLLNVIQIVCSACSATAELCR